jgi:hypothetical protein
VLGQRRKRRRISEPGKDQLCEESTFTFLPQPQMGDAAGMSGKTSRVGASTRSDQAKGSSGKIESTAQVAASEWESMPEAYRCKTTSSTVFICRLDASEGRLTIANLPSRISAEFEVNGLSADEGDCGAYSAFELESWRTWIGRGHSQTLWERFKGPVLSEDTFSASPTFVLLSFLLIYLVPTCHESSPSLHSQSRRTLSSPRNHWMNWNRARHRVNGRTAGITSTRFGGALFRGVPTTAI